MSMPMLRDGHGLVEVEMADGSTAGVEVPIHWWNSLTPLQPFGGLKLKVNQVKLKFKT